MRDKRILLIGWLICALVLLAPRAWAQSLPDLGGPGEAALSPQFERRICWQLS